MKFDLKRKPHPNMERYYKDDIDKAYRFANIIHKEMGSLLKCAVVFGSTARGNKNPGGDIDIMLVIDDLSIVLTSEVWEAYRLIANKAIQQTSTKIHLITLKLTSFWDYVRNGDPVIVNIMRDGFAMIDTGFFEPMQMLLKKGRVRPTTESIWTYYMRAPHTLANSKRHIAQGVLDLYWSVVDAGHAALMKIGEIPPTPEHLADLLDTKLVKTGKIEKKYSTTMRNFFRLMKMITHKEISTIKGEEYDKYKDEAQEFVDRMRKFIEEDGHY